MGHIKIRFMATEADGLSQYIQTGKVVTYAELLIYRSTTELLSVEQRRNIMERAFDKTRGMALGAGYEIDVIIVKPSVPLSLLIGSELVTRRGDLINSYEIEKEHIQEVWPLVEAILTDQEDIEYVFTKTFCPSAMRAHEYTAQACTVFFPTPRGTLYCDYKDVYECARAVERGANLVKAGILEMSFEEFDANPMVITWDGFKGILVDYYEEK